ncbi:DUF368 domain-containing protein [bacterium]|nr:DUF368 domain-containing protein [bacterium]
MSESTPPAGKLPIVRLTITGIFMGLANLVPGVSGGTMVLALGLYQEFIDAMSSISRLRLSMRHLTVLGMLFGLSFITILGFSSVIQYLMEMFKPGMLALFIGMTLGGAPSLWKELRPAGGSVVASIAVGFVVMATVALLLKPGLVEPSWLLLFLGGIIASSAMILPGISGSYMLLVMGIYLPIIAGVSAFKDALKAADVSAIMSIGLGIGVPVALGLAIGIVGFSSLLKFMMERYHKPTLGFLLGLLLGSVLGLYPFGQMSFDKLPRYAVTVAEGSPAVLNVMLFNAKGDDHPVRQSVQAVGSEKVKVVFLPTIEQEPSVSTIEAARLSKAVVIAYDQNLPREVRRAAADKKAGKVELILVPNSEFSPLKGVLVVVLAIVGFVLTVLLGRLGGGEKKPTEA